MHSGSVSMRRWSIVVFLLTAGAISRFLWIDHESLWLDEVTSLRLAEQTGSLHLEPLPFFSKWDDGHPALYYLLLRVWISMFGSGEVAVRSLSAVFGLAMLAATYYVGQRLISKDVGVLASGLVLVNAVALHYSQEVRMYTLIGLLGPVVNLELLPPGFTR